MGRRNIWAGILEPPGTQMPLHPLSECRTKVTACLEQTQVTPICKAQPQALDAQCGRACVSGGPADTCKALVWSGPPDAL